jgi:hypothetical protein
VWRSLGLGPADVKPGEHLPPGDRGQRGWISRDRAEATSRDRFHEVDDPPGTRGSLAQLRQSTG